MVAACFFDGGRTLTQTHATTRKITLTEVCEIIKDTAIEAAPKMIAIGDALEAIGRESELEPIVVVGDALESIARLTIQVLQLLGEDKSITVIDSNGSRSINEPRIALRVFSRIKTHAK